MNRARKTALIFPGLGYHPDKPLLYYGKKLAARLGYDVIEIKYGGFAWGVKDNPEKMREAFESALKQTEEILGEKGFHFGEADSQESLVGRSDSQEALVGGADKGERALAGEAGPKEVTMANPKNHEGDSFADGKDLLFISKSIGTAVAAAWQKKHGLAGRHLYFTPVAETFLFAEEKSGIAFHGTADSWVDTAVVKEQCRRLDIPLYITKDADHSMETGDVEEDLKTMQIIMRECRRYIKNSTCD